MRRFFKWLWHKTGITQRLLELQLKKYKWLYRKGDKVFYLTRNLPCIIHKLDIEYIKSKGHEYEICYDHHIYGLTYVWVYEDALRPLYSFNLKDDIELSRYLHSELVKNGTITT
jgi:hypothetical protein